MSVVKAMPIKAADKTERINNVLPSIDRVKKIKRLRQTLFSAMGLVTGPKLHDYIDVVETELVNSTRAAFDDVRGCDGLELLTQIKELAKAVTLN